MNIIFGQTGHPEEPRAFANNINAFFELHHGISADFIHLPPLNLLAGSLPSSGHTTGVASDGSCTLFFIGFLCHPLPDWHVGSPLDDPNVAAEWLLHRYRNVGMGFLDGLPGTYGLSVFDSRNRTIHLAADPYGQRTLYVSITSGQLSFSSNLATLSHLLGPQLSVDRELEDFFLTYGFYPQNRTPFAGVQALGAGQLMTWGSGGLSTRTIEPIESSRSTAPLPIDQERSLGKTVDLLYEGFMQALQDQMASTTEAGVLLGGLDSALVAAGLHRLGKKVSTWSFGYVDTQYNQPHTEDIAKYLGTRHEWVHISEQTLMSGLERFSYIFNQPTNWPNYVIQTAAVCARMREAGIDFAYSGDGCDTVFLGYPGTWQRTRVLQTVPSTPEWLSVLTAKLLARPFIERHAGHPWRVLLNLIRTSSWSPTARCFLSFRIFDEVSISQLRQGDTPEQESGLKEIVENLAAPFTDLPAIRLAYLGKSYVSPNRNKMIGSADLTGLPIISPYMHPVFRNFAQNLPVELCRPQGDGGTKITGKYVLMKMAEEKKLLPPQVIYQKKIAAVDAPVDQWYAGPMRDFMMDKMAFLPFKADRSYIASLLDRHVAEELFKRHVLTDKVIKHAPSLLATYASFCRLVSGLQANTRIKP